ncbi:hypothetical protein [Pseudogemmobacter faecipullorum]|uniref:Uncharacterized protein n=1 Tax=Pseudogemmobacter faecipullorum TaxID=2755041 RepID=A0ABS8CQ23_9RHOB|nr:hypothetical protein [Pseudogemmobacter faecipullorum]MCB5411490.1 hypothetical protein [Pseudogemmobacter faecipullorum]
MTFNRMAAQIVGLSLADLLGPQPEPRYTAGRKPSQPKPTAPTSKRAKGKAACKQRHRK